MRNCLSALLLIVGLSCCATFSDPLLPFIPVHVQVIHSDKTASGEHGHYAYASPDAVPNLSDTADLVTIKSWNIGILFRSLETIEWMAKDDAFRNEADIVVIRPRDTLNHVVWHLDAEIWRTKGYQQQINDDIPTPGTTLLPPPDTTFKIRVRNIEECAAESATLQHQPLSEDEASLIAGRDTSLFIDIVHDPRHDFFWRPTQLGWEKLIWTTVPEGASDRYVVCLLNRGYQWPQPSAGKR
ncbi:MAG: hypothetical protein AUJ57_02095 [Zetaproteobacteria bacterium CG1_02_53_45]|nr:MAG: hypothetical protein AUJ57_02095 [Zetaproteobacteria bacterium CG1_02_53_45]